MFYEQSRPLFLLRICAVAPGSKATTNIGGGSKPSQSRSTCHSATDQRVDRDTANSAYAPPHSRCECGVATERIVASVAKFPHTFEPGPRWQAARREDSAGGAAKAGASCHPKAQQQPPKSAPGSLLWCRRSVLKGVQCRSIDHQIQEGNGQAWGQLVYCQTPCLATFWLAICWTRQRLMLTS